MSRSGTRPADRGLDGRFFTPQLLTPYPRRRGPAEVEGAAFSLSAPEPAAAIAGARVTGALGIGGGGGAERLELELDVGGERPWVFESCGRGGRI